MVLVPPGTYGELLNKSGSVLSSIRLPAQASGPDLNASLLATSRASTLRLGSEKGSAGWLTYIGPRLSNGDRVVVALPTSGVTGSLNRLVLIELLGAVGLLVVPAFACAYLLAAPTWPRRRVLQLLGAGAAMVVSAGWWVLTVAVWPTGSRPMIDGSPTNSILNLILDYNGLGRLTGNGGGGAGGNFSGTTGLFRLFNSLMGGQASWLLPTALALLIGGLWLTLKAPRTDRTRACLLYTSRCV